MRVDSPDRFLVFLKSSDAPAVVLKEYFYPRIGEKIRCVTGIYEVVDIVHHVTSFDSHVAGSEIYLRRADVPFVDYHGQVDVRP